MYAPNTWNPTKPNSHSTNRTTKIVQSICICLLANASY
jgi:hypothetical protein